jgi:hypothetical protein
VIAALRRLVIAFLVLSAATVLVSLVIGLIAGTSLERSLSLGFDLIGMLFLVIGFFVGMRGPFRMSGGEIPGGRRFVRWAQPDEANETINVSALLVTLGFAFIVIGLTIDPRYSLF